MKLQALIVLQLLLLGVCLAQGPKATESDPPEDTGGETETEEDQVVGGDVEESHEGNEGDDDETVGTGEDPNGGEKVAEQEHEEAVRRDEEGEALDMAESHGLLAEEILAQHYREYQDQLVADENQAGESDYVIEIRLEEEKHQQEIEEEREESERLRAEERRLREERIRMELRDQEEWEAMLAGRGDEEEEEEEEEGEGHSDEVDVDGDDDVNDGDAGSAALRPLWISAVLVLLLPIVL